MRPHPPSLAALALIAFGAVVVATLGTGRAAPAPDASTQAIPPSRSLGRPWKGRLVRGVKLPARGPDHLTWDPVRNTRPNRAWRRWGTDRLVRLTLVVARDHRAAFPGVPRVLVGDLSRRGGGDFGVRYGRPGHQSHQNGRDVDVYYPRADRREIAPRRAREIDRLLAQDLVDRFVAAGAKYVFVGPHTGLIGPAEVVQELAMHDDHMHVRLPPRPRRAELLLTGAATPAPP
jgi:murein endopeptidase